MLFNLFKSKKEEPETDYSAIKVDMHSHLIPGIDDGAQNMEESLALIRSLADLGYKKIITTPHIMVDYYRNTPEIINQGLQNLREAVLKEHIDIQIEAAAEYYLDETFDSKLEKGNILSFGDKFLLFEISFVNYPQSLFNIIAKIKSKGYKPILAHPERYPYLGVAIENYERIREAGCYLQLNTISLAGYYGKTTQKIAEQLIDHHLIDFIGSDMHHLKHAEALKQALYNSYFKKILTNYPFKNQLLTS